MFDFEYIKDIVKKNISSIIGTLFGIACLIISISIVLYDKSKLKTFDSSECPVCVNEDSEEPVEPTVNKIKVDVKGAVKKAGVYELDNESTIDDAIKIAGGVTSKATTANINLAKKLTDQMVIYVFTKQELQEKKSANEVVCEIPKCECETVTIEECPKVNTNVNINDNTNKSDNTTDDLISINTGSIEELTKLEGIGESKAQAIIDYRTNNGPFKTLEELMNVSGIGEKAFEKIKNNIKL